ncbi:MAG: glycosyltransferase family 1 protein [Candidatus Sulfotelmatobacter sp.]
MRLFINALAASAGGGLTYIRNVLPHLSGRTDVKVSIALRSALRQEFRCFRDIDFLETDGSAGRRFWYEQSVLPGMIRRCQADVLLSAGNFAIRRSPVPQILLSRNSIYLSSDYYRDLLARREYRTWLETRSRGFLAKKSIHWADLTVAPSEAFASDLTRWSGRRVLAVHHGFDFDQFCGDESPLSANVSEKLRGVEGALRILFVSHYNYYRNFETLLRALPLIRERLSNRRVKLMLTCELAPGKNPGAYRTERVSRLVRELGIGESIVELGAVPYRQLHHLYRQADVYVSAAYTETFAHPLAEAMASGVPVVASDIRVHREICEDAAAYFPRFSPDALAQTVVHIISSSATMQQMVTAGRKRSLQFSWGTHVKRILELCRSLINSPVRSEMPESLGA